VYMSSEAPSRTAQLVHTPDEAATTAVEKTTEDRAKAEQNLYF